MSGTCHIIMSIEFNLKYDFSEDTDFIDTGTYGIIRIDDNSFRVNWSKFFHLSSAIQKQMTLEKLLSQQLIILKDCKQKNYFNGLHSIFNYIDGDQIKIDYSNYKEINYLAHYFGLSKICEISTPLTIFYQQVKLIRKQIGADTPEVIHILAILFPLIQRLPITFSIFDLIKHQTMIKILDDSKLFPISDDEKVKVLYHYLEDFPDVILHYISRHVYYISEILFNDLHEKIKSLPEKVGQAFFQSIKIGMKGTGNSAIERLNRIREKEFLDCWDNFVSNLSQSKCYRPLDKDEEKRNFQMISTPIYQTMSNSSSYDILNQIPVEETPTQPEIHFSTQYLNPSEKHYILS